MIEVALKEYLELNLDGVPVVLEKPKTPPQKYVVLRLVDGGLIDHIDAATFFVDIFADSLYVAAELRDQIKDILLNATELGGIAHAGLGGERSNLDTANHVYVYELTYNFYYYREEI